MKDTISSKYHLFSGLSVLVISFLAFTTTVSYFVLYKPCISDISDVMYAQGANAVVHSDSFQVVIIYSVILLLLYVVTLHFSYQYFGVLYLTQEGVLLKALFKRRIYIPYTEILELGIDVGTTKQFWIYILSLIHI